ncbi:hypothetical protein CVT26_008877, partial [Gymnopilus dilepis]
PKRSRRGVSIPDAPPPPTKAPLEVECQDTERGTKRQEIKGESGRAEDECLKSPLFRDLEESSRCSIPPDDVTTSVEHTHSEQPQQVPLKAPQVPNFKGLQTTQAQDVQSSSEGPVAEPSTGTSLRTANLPPDEVPLTCLPSAGSTLQEPVATMLPSSRCPVVL